uniref:Uncharacterized protein n=1 Tax=Guillardia theta TaxID=55529 RepID=A0A6U5Y498_GUITH|mmetsp:Transcript_19481/g.64520  ORF Transcript_19481/g.64520 Transcript_19481/m.64520 type:complete len:859 (+) Transcript_19481:143-2719(+)
MQQAEGLAEHAQQEFLVRNAEKKAAWDLVAARKAELDQAELSGDRKRKGEANMKLLSARLAVARLEADEKKRVEARKQVWQEEHELAGLERDTVREALALVNVRKAELELAGLEEDQKKKAEAEYWCTDAELELSVATAKASLAKAERNDVGRCTREYDIASYALISHRFDGREGKFLSVLNDIAKTINLNEVLIRLKEFVQNSLDFAWTSESSRVRPSEEFSSLNPIDRIVEKAKTDQDPYLCMIEACSGCGKSLTAVDFFVRNADVSIYFLFNPSQRVDTVQDIYEPVEQITRLINKAIECDLSMLAKSHAGSQGTAPLDALEVDFATDGRKLHLLGVLAFLWSEETTWAPVSVKDAQNWKKRRWVLVDEVIPPQQEDTCIFSVTAKIVLLRRVLINSKINCILLGTNTMVMNLGMVSQSSQHLRNKVRRIYCFTHRSLPPYILPSDASEEVMNKVFGKAQVPKLLDHVNPWTCSLFLRELGRVLENSKPHMLIQSVSRTLWQLITAAKPSLRKESIYCMFQIAAREPVSQLHISQGFALLNVWGNYPPPRNSEEATVLLDLEDRKPALKGTFLSELTSRFASAVLDPITTVACAGGGMPFSHASALEVLQKIHLDQRIGQESLSRDAWKRDGNLLESFGAVVVMISSWSPPQDLLKNFAFHCGMKDERKVDDILASVANKESFVEMLTSCMCNLVPVRESEYEHSLSAVLGSYVRNKDMKGRDGTFSGPASKWRGGAKFKNRSAESPLQSKSSEYITSLLSHNLDVNIFMVAEMSFDIEGYMSSMYDGTEWLVLHLENKGKQKWTASTFRRPTNKRKKGEADSVDERMVEKILRKRVLIVVEIGMQTMPFCGQQC